MFFYSLFVVFCGLRRDVETDCTGFRARKEVMQLREKVKEGENFVEVATESAELKERKLKKELATASRLLSKALEELLEQKALAEKRPEKGERALEELRARLTVTPQKYPRIFIIILLYISSINRTKLGFF